MNLDKYFGISESKSTVRTEIIAGITTFITMAYIIFVNPSILGVPFEGKPDAEAIKGSIFMATCISAAIGTLIMGLYARLPFAQAPGMGLNAFFTYTIILGMGYTFNQALAAVFISGIIFILITIFGLREQIVKAIPTNIKYSITAGIGLFIALIGMANAKIIVANPATLVQLIDFSKFNSPDVRSAVVALIGMLIIGILMLLKVRGAILIGIIISSIIAIPFGITNLAGLKWSFTLPSMAPTFWKFDFNGLLGLNGQNIWGVLFNSFTVIIAFFLVDMFDTLGTLLGTARKANMLDAEGNLPRMKKAMMADAVATAVGACLGTSTVTTYIESAAGISEGGKTGLTSVVTGILFIVAIFFAPLLGFIPSAATAPALIVVGVLMMSSIKYVEFEDISEGIPAFLTITLMPFAYSIATGIAAGLIAYPVLKICSGKAKEVHPIAYVLAILFILRFAIVPH